MVSTISSCNVSPTQQPNTGSQVTLGDQDWKKGAAHKILPWLQGEVTLCPSHSVCEPQWSCTAGLESGPSTRRDSRGLSIFYEVFEYLNQRVYSISQAFPTARVYSRVQVKYVQDLPVTLDLGNGSRHQPQGHCCDALHSDYSLAGCIWLQHSLLYGAFPKCVFLRSSWKSHLWCQRHSWRGWHGIYRQDKPFYAVRPLCI